MNFLSKRADGTLVIMWLCMLAANLVIWNFPIQKGSPLGLMWIGVVFLFSIFLGLVLGDIPGKNYENGYWLLPEMRIFFLCSMPIIIGIGIGISLVYL